MVNINNTGNYVELSDLSLNFSILQRSSQLFDSDHLQIPPTTSLVLVSLSVEYSWCSEILHFLVYLQVHLPAHVAEPIRTPGLPVSCQLTDCLEYIRDSCSPCVWTSLQQKGADGVVTLCILSLRGRIEENPEFCTYSGNIDSVTKKNNASADGSCGASEPSLQWHAKQLKPRAWAE